MKLYLIRHAQTLANVKRIYNPEDDALTPEGAAEAMRASAFFKTLTYDASYCSPLPRAKETARLLGLSATPSDALTDHKFGTFSGQPWGSLGTKAHELGLSREEFVPEGGESITAAKKRAVAFVQSLPEGTYVLVAHAGTIIDIVSTLTGRHWSTMKVQNLAIWELDNNKVVQENWKPWQTFK